MNFSIVNFVMVAVGSIAAGMAFAVNDLGTALLNLFFVAVNGIFVVRDLLALDKYE